MDKFESKIINLMMMFFILLCMTFLSQGGCLKEMNGVRCQTVQEAGEHLAENIDKFDKLLQEVVMRCYEESKELTKSALKRLTADLKNVKLAKSTDSAPITSLSKVRVVADQMAKALEASFNAGHAEFFSLIKRGGAMVIGDSIVVDAVIKYPQRAKRDVTNLNGIDGKILTLKNEMSSSLNGVEDNIRKVEEHLFVLLADSLKELVDDSQFRKNLDKNRVQMTAYLNDAIHNVMESYVGRFFELVKDSAQVLERVDSIVASMKNDKGELKKATQPARVLVDEAIANLNKKTGITEMKRQIAMNIIWTRKAYQDVRTNISG